MISEIKNPFEPGDDARASQSEGFNLSAILDSINIVVMAENAALKAENAALKAATSAIPIR